MLSPRNKNSFTLIELLIVIAIVAIIAGAVLVAINPARRIAEAQDSRRHSEVNSILTAVNSFVVDNMGDVPDCGGDGNIPNDSRWRFLGTTPGTDYRLSAQGVWLMDDDLSDSITNDSSLNNNVGSCWLGGDRCPSIVMGANGNAYEFDGSDDDFSYGNDGTLNPSTEATIGAYVYIKSTTAAGQWLSIFNKDSQFSLTQDQDGSDVFAYIKTDGTNEVWCSFSGWQDLPLNTWHHLYFTYDAGTDFLSVYRNGSLVESCWSATTALNPDSGSDLLMAPWFSFDGIVDEAAIFDQALTADQIEEIYTYGLTGENCDMTAGLVDSGYLSSIPQDPSQGNINNTGYLIKRDPTGAFSVKAPFASDYAEQEIMVSR